MFTQTIFRFPALLALAAALFSLPQGMDGVLATLVLFWATLLFTVAWAAIRAPEVLSAPEGPNPWMTWSVALYELGLMHAAGNLKQQTLDLVMAKDADDNDVKLSQILGLIMHELHGKLDFEQVKAMDLGGGELSRIFKMIDASPGVTGDTGVTGKLRFLTGGSDMKRQSSLAKLVRRDPDGCERVYILKQRSELWLTMASISELLGSFPRGQVTAIAVGSKDTHVIVPDGKSGTYPTNNPEAIPPVLSSIILAGGSALFSLDQNGLQKMAPEQFQNCSVDGTLTHVDESLGRTIATHFREGKRVTLDNAKGNALRAIMERAPEATCFLFPERKFTSATDGGSSVEKSLLNHSGQDQ
jgi:hypothetical protein